MIIAGPAALAGLALIIRERAAQQKTVEAMT